MALTQLQKESMIRQSMELARLLTDWNRKFNGFKEEYDSQDYGTVMLVEDLAALNLSNTFTKAEWTDAIAALDLISAAVETNKTNIYKIATGK